MKRPSFQFYPGDWLNDAALRMVSVGARGLWIEMICLMHQGSEYGYLKVNGKVILPPNLARMIGATLDEVQGWLTELNEAGVYSVDANNCIFSRRMIRDEEIRKARADGGSKGGNPALMAKNKVNNKVNLNANLQPTPSSSSSSSSSDIKTLSDKSDEARQLIQFLNLKTGKQFRDGKENLTLIKARLKDYSFDELKAVIAKKSREWLKDDAMQIYLRPATLFNATKCAQYIGELVKVEG